MLCFRKRTGGKVKTGLGETGLHHPEWLGGSQLFSFLWLNNADFQVGPQSLRGSSKVLRSAQHPSLSLMLCQPTPPRQVNPRLILPPILLAGLSPHDIKPTQPAILRAHPRVTDFSGRTHQAASFPSGSPNEPKSCLCQSCPGPNPESSSSQPQRTRFLV